MIQAQGPPSIPQPLEWVNSPATLLSANHNSADGQAPNRPVNQLPMLRALYDRTMALAAHRHAVWALFAISFIESSIFPIPPDVLQIAMTLADRSKAWFYALVSTIGSTLGGLLGYAIGFFLFETAGRWILDLYGYADKFEQFAAQYNEYGAWIVFMAGFTPFPYKVITIASGVTHLDLLTFVVASFVGRGARFFLVGALLYWFGPPIRAFIEKYLGLLTIAFFLLLVGGFVALRYFA
jgi:membrane protein YqaA with SNARE-associated domain